MAELSFLSPQSPHCHGAWVNLHIFITKLRFFIVKIWSKGNRKDKVVFFLFVSKFVNHKLEILPANHIAAVNSILVDTLYLEQNDVIEHSSSELKVIWTKD